MLPDGQLRVMGYDVDFGIQHRRGSGLLYATFFNDDGNMDKAFSKPGKTTMGKKPKGAIVVGIGNPLLKDDRVGIEVVEALKAQDADVETAVLYAVGFDVLNTIMGYEQAVIVDACQMGMKPGTILEISPEEMFSQDHLVNSHAVTLGSTLKTGQMLFPEEMPGDLKLILVEVEDISTFSTQCTPVVSHAIADVVERISNTTPCCQR